MFDHNSGGDVSDDTSPLLTATITDGLVDFQDKRIVVTSLDKIRPLADTQAPLQTDAYHVSIALGAYYRYIARGGVPGQDLDDWLEAVRLVLQRHRAVDVSPANAAREQAAPTGKKSRLAEGRMT